MSSRIVWLMALAAILALDCAGMVYGSNRTASYCVAVTLIAPFAITIAALAVRLGPGVLGR